MKRPPAVPSDPLWYKDAVFYELRVRSFYDGNGDGIGDFAGLTEKLGYLEDLGVTVLWLLPFYPSPMRDDGYDIADYTDVHPDCGTLAEFKAFLAEAHRRGFRVVTELVLNHTSDQHPWFQRARRDAPGSSARDFYVWSDTSERYPEARIIFQEFEHSNWAWDPVARSHYWHRFYSHQPDLNFDNPEVRKALFKVVDFWLDLGVDGLRLDAVPYLFQRDGTNCENLPETHAYLKQLRRHVDGKYQDRMLLAEANQWPEDAVAYLDPEECHMAFHFPIMPRLFMAVHMEDRFPLTDILAQTPVLPESSQWALFLRNHDELTLEMVSEEERDYMYRAYAREQRMRVNLGIRRRLSPLLNNNRRQVELLKGLLFSLPGTPVLYYGDEIGMGDNVYLGDRDGVRTPMQWSADRNAGFSRANPQRLILPITIDPQYHYETINVEAQEQSRHSLLWWTRRLIALRKQFKAFGRGTLELIDPHNHKVLAFIRRHGDERILVVANLSRFVQYVELDLSNFKGMVPRELFGHTPFPRIGDQPYLVMLSPHSFYWFSLEAPGSASLAGATAFHPPALVAPGSWETFDKTALEELLPQYLAHCRWFGGKGRPINSVQLTESLPFSTSSSRAFLHLVQVDYADGEAETYALPLAFVTDEEARVIQAQRPEAVLAELTLTAENGQRGLVVDALSDPQSCRQLLGLVDRRRRLRGESGEAVSLLSRSYSELRGPPGTPLEPRISRAEQSNTSVIYGDRLILKLFRRLDEGPSPELEMGRALTARGFPNTPPLVGHLEYRSGKKPPTTLAVVQSFIANQGDAWSYTLDELRQFFERALTRKSHPLPPVNKPLVQLEASDLPAEVSELIGPYLEGVRLMGRRTAELHLALSTRTDDPAFTPEAYSTLFQRAAYQSMRNLVGQSFRSLRRGLPGLAPPMQAQVQALLSHEQRLVRRFGAFLHRRISVVRIRCHGDLHLGQVLHTGKDFVFIDFEGEPVRPLSDRRRKRSALRDVAGMLRSFDYAMHTALERQEQEGFLGEKSRPMLEPWARAWQAWVSHAFLNEYLATAGKAQFVPRDREELKVLLDAFLLEKATYELEYELRNRPAWLSIPIQGIEQILGREQE